MREYFAGTAWRFGPASLGLLAAWVALFAWSGMVERPETFLTATAAIGLVMMLAGVALRAAGITAWAVAAVQALVAALGLTVVAGHDSALIGFVPTVAAVRETAYRVVNGAATLDQYSSPVRVNPHSTAAMLTGCGLLVILAVDVLALGVRRAPLAALPLLVALSVPVSILQAGLALPVFVGVALLFLRLLASDHLSSFAAWGRQSRRTPGGMLTTFWQVSIVAVLVALIAAPVVPVTDLLKRDQGSGGGGASGGSLQLTTVNPFIRLRRDLVAQTHTPLVYARTKAPSTSYLRTTVLDQFTGDEWRPSPRKLPSSNSADGNFPDPPGLAAGIAGSTDTWTLSLDPRFSTSWLPLPYPVLSVKVPGGWRYDSTTLDVAYVGSGAPTPLDYTVRAFTPTITAALLRSPIPAPQSIRRPMTQLPPGFPKVITERAKQVTAGATTNFDKAVALQDWFRSTGGFTYSLDQRGGSGMDLLAHFVTDDKVGYCEQFAAAMAAMGRSLGIPSRVVVGFLDGQQLNDGRILYTSDERHAWPEMYFTGVGWVRFEPTPAARSGNSPPWTRVVDQTTTPTQAPTSAPSLAPKVPKDQNTTAQSTTGSHSFSVPWRAGTGGVLLVLLALGPGALRGWQRRRRLSSEDPLHLAEGAWAELHASAVDLGLEWPEERSPREQARSVADQVGAGADDVRSLEGLLGQVERGRYAPGGRVDTLAPEARTRTVETVESWRTAMGAKAGHRWRGWLWPRSVLRRYRD